MSNEQDKAELAAFQLATKSANNSGLEHLRKAILTMRESADEAERELKNIERNGLDATTVGRILHIFMWGHANATSSIGAALNRVNDIMAAERALGKSETRQ